MRPADPASLSQQKPAGSGSSGEQAADRDTCPARCLRRRHRRVWAVGRGAHRGPAGEVAVRAGGVLPHAVPQPADALRQAAAAAAVAAHRQLAGHRAALLRAAGGQDAHRDADPRHAAERQQLQLALHVHHVTQRLAAARVGVAVLLALMSC